jgi:hypothetical protein
MQLSSRWLGRVRWVLVLGLATLAALYYAKGFYSLTREERGATDLYKRWQESQYFLRGQNHYDVAFHNTPLLRRLSGVTEAPLGRDVRVEPSIGVMGEIGYPPWAIPMLALFTWPSWNEARIYYALIHLIALFVILRALVIQTRGVNAEIRPILIVGGMSMSAYCWTLGVGQLGILVTALLFLYLEFEIRRPWLAGLFLGLSYVKPQISLPFILLSLVRGRFQPIVVSALVAVVSTAVCWVATHTPPWEMLEQERVAYRFYAHTSAGLGTYLTWLGLQLNVATSIVALAVLIPTVAGAWRFRSQSPYFLAALLTVGARLFTYHGFYDNVMLIFLLLELGKRVAQRPAPWLVAAYAVCGLSLWIPDPGSYPFVAFVPQMLAWLFAVAVLVRDEQKAHVPKQIPSFEQSVGATA